jgi:hypothetical protein
MPSLLSEPHRFGWHIVMPDASVTPGILEPSPVNDSTIRLEITAFSQPDGLRPHHDD